MNKVFLFLAVLLFIVSAFLPGTRTGWKSLKYIDGSYRRSFTH